LFESTQAHHFFNPDGTFGAELVAGVGMDLFSWLAKYNPLDSHLLGSL